MSVLVRFELSRLSGLEGLSECLCVLRHDLISSMASLSSVSNSAPQEQVSLIILRPTRSEESCCTPIKVSHHEFFAVLTFRRIYFFCKWGYDVGFSITSRANKLVGWHKLSFLWSCRDSNSILATAPAGLDCNRNHFSP